MEQYIPNTKVLYVDDEANLLASFSSLMWREHFDIHTLADSTTIQTVLEQDGPFALVISDQRMPGLDGVGVLKKVRAVHPETIRVLMTGFASQEDTQRAINESGVSRYINKPWNDAGLKQLVRECVDHFNLAMQNRELTVQLSRQNVMLEQLLEGTVGQSVRLLSNLLVYINPHAANQTERIRKLGKALLDLVPGVSSDEKWEVERALDLFNLGIAVLPPLIQVTLNKDGLGMMERFPAAVNHNLVAAELLKEIPRFEKVAAIIRYQAKNFDGTGRPDTEMIGGKNLPLGSRILHILLDLERLSTEHFKGREVLVEMSKRPAKYDVELIGLMLHGGGVQKGKVKNASLALDELQVGMFVVDDVKTKSGQVLLQRNTVLTEVSTKILRQWNRFDPIVEPISVIYNER